MSDEHNRFLGYNKDHTCSFSFWEGLKVRLLGEKVVTMDGPWRCTAYYYHSKWYIFDIKNTAQ